MEEKPILLKSVENIYDFKVVNDIAERGNKLMQDFNSSLTKDETQTIFVTSCI